MSKLQLEKFGMLGPNKFFEIFWYVWSKHGRSIIGVVTFHPKPNDVSQVETVGT